MAPVNAPASRGRGLILLAPVVLLLAVPSLLASDKKKNEKVRKDVPDLVWPLPPEKPRIKYAGWVSDNTDVEPPQKKGWLSKLINEEETRRVFGMTRPAGIAVDSSGRIYVADTLKAVVFVFDMDKKRLSLLGGDARGRLAGPFGIAIDDKDNVYVSDTGLKRVNVYDKSGKLTAAIKKVGSETIVNPAGLAIDPGRGRLYIVDSQGHRVFWADLNQLDKGGSFGTRGEDDNEFNFPSYVAVDPQGNLYVTDTLNFCVKVFDKDFKFTRRIGEHGTGFGMFDRPKGIALDSEGNIYVVDATFSNFQIFNPEGQLLLFVGGFGEEPGSFRLPSGIFIDKKDRIYVSDQINRRLQIFQLLRGKS
ncbi:MAG TPA: SMP-30/gluconolactonase/LRE family protein [Blastocatellia bacterium]|nr:SMP-30/gluconolactonase/LRE family protein [Blastocatellia bacterium]